MLTTIRRVLGRHWHLAMAVTLVAATLLGALVQSGSLAPDFHVNSTGPEYAHLQNISWRSWTITSAQLANAKHPIVLPDRSIISRVLVYPGVPQNLTSALEHPAKFPLSVGRGQQITVTLLQEHQKQCPSAFDYPLNEIPQQDTYEIPVDLVFATPLGARTLVETLLVDYGCPYA
jgi:hypothetical protein